VPYKHFAPESQRRPFPPYARIVGLVALSVVAAFLVSVIVTSIVQHRSPADVLASFMIEAPQEHFHKDRIVVALFGIDYNYDSKDQPFSIGARTDTIKAISIIFPTKDDPHGSVSMLSVPRDMDYVFPSGHEDRINAAYSYGKDPFDSSHRAETAVADFLGLPKFDRFITFRIHAAQDLINAIGGIDVVPDTSMNYDDHWGHLSIHFTKGLMYHMNGEQAVGYSRFRHDPCGDPCRIKRQDQVMRIALRKVSDDKFNDLLHINQLIAVFRRNVITDVSDREAFSIANAMRGIDMRTVKSDQVPYVSDKDLRCCGNVIVADDAAKKALVKKFFFDAPVSALPARLALKQIQKSSIHLDIRNGSGVRGVAHQLADALRKEGFAVDSVGDAKSRDHEATEVHVFSTTPLVGEAVLQALPMKTAVVVPEPYTAAVGTEKKADVTIIIGRDYNGPQREASAVK
jgi:LCP family protein required for cell wall assembly